VTQRGGYQRNIGDLLAYQNSADPASPDTFARRTMDRYGIYDSASDAGHVALATGVMTAVPIFLYAGDLITNVVFVTGATAGATITDSWAALYGIGAAAATQLLVAQSTTTGAGALAANTVITKPLTTPFTVPTTGVYHVGINVTAGTIPTLLGTVVAAAVTALGERALAKTSGSGLTTTAPANLGVTPGVKEFCPYVVLT
jgi:hypothetical protein